MMIVERMQVNIKCCKDDMFFHLMEFTPNDSEKPTRWVSKKFCPNCGKQHTVTFAVAAVEPHSREHTTMSEEALRIKNEE